MSDSCADPPWEVDPGTARVVVIGDVHGDLDALLRILLGTQVLGPDGCWIDKFSHLVLLGDLNDRGPDSTAVMSLVMDLETEARANGARIYTLLGNHKMLAAKGDYSYVRATEVLALEDFRYETLVGLHAIHRGNSPWARWLRRRPTILKIGVSLFVHAGVDAWALDMAPRSVNALIQNWVAHFQGVAEQPDEATFWLTAESGPLWCNAFAVGTAPKNLNKARLVLSKVLSHLGVQRVVVGHHPTAPLGYRIALPHPVYGDSAVGVNTGISKYFGGWLSALEIIGDSLSPLYFERGDAELSLTLSLTAKYNNNLRDLDGRRADF